MWKTSWSERIERLDPERDALEVHQLVCAYEFPWDTLQALSFALFRTYAVPSIGALLDRTGELTGRSQRRYEDTGLLLDAVLEHGADSRTGRQALRRVNAMHAAYDISNDDMRYVQSTFVVIPMRWIDRFGWRASTEPERRASANYYRELGRHMNIKDSPVTYEQFAAYLDAYEREHFARSRDGRAVSDATLALLVGLYPAPLRPVMRRVTMALLDPPLRRPSAIRILGRRRRRSPWAGSAPAPSSSAGSRLAGGRATSARCPPSRSIPRATPSSDSGPSRRPAGAPGPPEQRRARHDPSGPQRVGRRNLIEKSCVCGFRYLSVRASFVVRWFSWKTWRPLVMSLS